LTFDFFRFFRAGKDAQPIEILPDEPEPFSFAGQLLITGISLTCRLITAEMQQINFYRLIQLPSLTNLSMPLPIIPILQSGLIYPGKQSIIKYFMLIPTPKVVHNEEVNDRNIFLFDEHL
jgi:enolase